MDEEKTKVTETTTTTNAAETPAGDQKTTRVATTTATDEGTPSPLTLAERIIYLVMIILQTLLLFRFLLSLLGANRGNGFAEFVFTTSAPFVQPFMGLFGFETAYGASRIEIETIIAALVYAVLTMIVIALLRLPRKSPEE
jgi:hypothetical protein